MPSGLRSTLERSAGISAVVSFDQHVQLCASGEAYDQQERSALLPTLDLGLLSQFVAIRSQLLAVKSFRAALRDRR